MTNLLLSAVLATNFQWGYIPEGKFEFYVNYELRQIILEDSSYVVTSKVKPIVTQTNGTWYVRFRGSK